MKAFRCRSKGGQSFVLFLVILSCGAKSFAQTTGIVPIVTVQATQPVATVADPGVFTVFRAGDTNAALNVWYDLGGTASNGVDYATIPDHLMTIAAGTTSSTITITPLESVASSIAKTVVLTLTNSPMLNPVNYEIGSPNSAVVFIKSNGATNLPPVVNIIEPLDGSVFYTPTNIEILTKASDLDGNVTNVEFFAGATDLGPGTPVVLDPPGVGGVVGLVYLFNWQNVPPGNYPLTAVATDNGGASTTSAVVNISVLQGPPPNQPPVVRMVSPANGEAFFAPINIPLYAYANDPDGSVTSVEFFDGTNSLGFGHSVPVATPLTPDYIIVGGPLPVPPVFPTNLFFLTWSNAPIGLHVLTAEATDNGGASSTSAPVKIAVLPSPPPPTNRPPIVSIVATDPVAIEGTNCWIWPGESNATPTWAAWPTAVCRWFTNCGPKTATFTVRRCGDTNGDLTVPYDIGGTASNGVDYVALPGSVTIPAGEFRALITIVPIDDGPPDVNKTVILALEPSTNTPPDYALGFPRRAAAIIVDSDGPRPAAAVLPDKCFHLTATGPDAAWFCVQYSTDMVNWISVCTNQVVDGSIDFVDPDAAGSPSRFYRALPLTNVPSD
ncbi:MAG TPA: Ig-like domain-containing protein [Candidatus Aquilonibacter sp.]|nr:Ig-like domain-containing protein [Candidatus Aquilonibacter sp.]